MKRIIEPFKIKSIEPLYYTTREQPQQILKEAPGAPKEDTSGGFKYDGWATPYDDEVSGKVM